MSLDNLRGLYSKLSWETAGADKKQLRINLQAVGKTCQSEFRVMSTAMAELFKVPSVALHGDIYLCYDELSGRGHSNGLWTKSPWDGCYFFGLLYRRGRHDIPEVSHMFVRNMSGFMGTLIQWDSDVVYPSEICEFSICTVFPRGYQPKGFELKDVRNSMVTQYQQEELDRLGIDLPLLIDYIKTHGSDSFIIEEGLKKNA